MLGKRAVLRCSFAIVVAGVLAGCTNLPASGPYPVSVATGSTSTLASNRITPELEYALVDLSAVVLQYAGAGGPNSLYRSFGGSKRGPAPELLVGVGDQIQVTIFEAATGGLFIPADAGP